MPEFSSTQRQYIRKRTKVHELDPSEMVGELNIVPFLDIVVNLIMFLLMTTAMILPIVQLDSQLPSFGRGRSTGANNRQALNLNITITDAGVIVTGSGGKLAPGCTTTGVGSVLTVPKRNGHYDWPGLGECLARVKSQFPDEEQAIVTADPLIMYEHVVAAMDATRYKGADVLFPKIMLSAGIR